MSTLYNNPQVVSTGSNNNPDHQTYPEAASQSFKAGELVYLVSGKVTVCGADPTKILGRALVDATGVTDTDIAVEIFRSDYKIKMQVYDSVGAAVDTSDNVVKGNRYEIALVSNVWYVDYQNTTNVRVVGWNQNKDAEGNFDSFAIVSFLSEYCQLEGSVQ